MTRVASTNTVSTLAPPTCAEETPNASYNPTYHSVAVHWELKVIHKWPASPAFVNTTRTAQTTKPAIDLTESVDLYAKVVFVQALQPV